jgi:hypothetical protein
MHEPLVVTPDRLVIPCISDRCLPSSLIDEVYILTVLLLLQFLIERWTHREPIVISGGRHALAP